jgi:DNA/RNA-binding domain of Phe-tRNA-synthetase-like protein
MEDVKIQIGPVLKNINPIMEVGIIESKVINSAYSRELWNEIQQITIQVRESFTFETIKDQPRIAATRKMYSACGKDPSRYRPSAEALMRRIVKGQDLYQINTLVDLINLVSLKSGYSIGGFDTSFIEGSVEAGLGRPGEVFHAIGRDTKGPIGTPTSDEERTAIRSETNHLLLVINAYDGPDGLTTVMDYALDLLKQHAGATLLNREIIAA